MDRKTGEMLTCATNGRIHQVDIEKVSKGAFHTKGDAWLTSHVIDFIQSSSTTSCLDPYAGGGDMLQLIGKRLNLDLIGYDIDENLKWPINDGLLNIPNKEKSIIITNPPFLSNYSARRKSLWSKVGGYFEESKYGDLYMIALNECLKASDYVVSIVPETFISSNFPKERCHSISILERNPFSDTTFPVCVTCWGPVESEEIQMFKDEIPIGTFQDMMEIKIIPNNSIKMRFNVPTGRIGLRAVDGTKMGDRICFMDGNELGYNRENIKVSSRLMTYIEIPTLDKSKIDEFCRKANEILESLRIESQDIILSGFKGNNKNGSRRRRLDYRLARGIIEKAYYLVHPTID